MSNLLEITAEDIARLDDSELRELIGLLCEEDYRLAGLSTKGITWGGNQDASDGGLDVVVRDEKSLPGNSYIPRSHTGFQVKKSYMPKSEILKEMRPKGVLRESIKALIKNNGAYIIVSSGSSTTDTALNNRLEGMKEAVATEEGCENLHLDFLDRGRVATWVRSQHPSLILWVRNKIGRPLDGWQSYGNWARAPSGINEEYILDDEIRLHDGTQISSAELSTKDGLQKLRSILSAPGMSVRLTGLSGVGKTRLVQALFDHRVGEHALDPSLAMYTDISNSPDPGPFGLANQVTANNFRVILIVDNCPFELHRRVTEICSRPESTVSLLTVEYDVRDDLPEETSVFRLEPASIKLIEKLINKRFLHISQVDARTIASFSGGNARIAIALANTVEKGETLSGFRDEELFERLFEQRHGSIESLRISAEACSLVYSFEGTDTSSDKSELKFLASLVGKTTAELYRDVATLKGRDLVQSRGPWRAVLPQAITNRLAKRALESISKETLVNEFLNNASERLIRSFSRRLSYLHDCAVAVEIANDWLGDEGWVGSSIENLNRLGIDVLRNIAPVSPEKTLETIERASNGSEGDKFTSRENANYNELVQLLWHLAYDPAFFIRSVEILIRYALSERKDENTNSIRDVLKSLFHIYLSGTHAPVELRANIIEELVDSEDQDKQDLGLALLGATLEAWHFSSFHEFEFGARPRDFGFQPQTQDEITHWYNIVIGICTRLALSDKPIAEKVRKLLANRLRGLWTKRGIFDVLEESARKIHEQRSWNDGWIAVRGIIRYDNKAFSDEVKERLYRIEAFLKPVNLLEQARTYVLSDQHMTFDLEDDYDDDEKASAGWERAEERACKIGTQVAQCNKTLAILLPDLVSTHNTRLESFGRGLAEGCSEKQEIWQLLSAEFKNTPTEKRNIGIFIGFLSWHAENDPTFYNSILDDLIIDEALGEWLPILQASSAIDKRGVERLHEALDSRVTPIDRFQNLAWGYAHKSISDDDLAGLLVNILNRTGGAGVAIEILHMRFHGVDEGASSNISNRLMDVAQKALSVYDFSTKTGRFGQSDYSLSDIASVCLTGKNGAHAARSICLNIVKSFKDYSFSSHNFSKLLTSIAKHQPKAFLDAFLTNEDVDDYQRKQVFSDSFDLNENPLNQIQKVELLSWCEDDPYVRYPLVTSIIDAFQISDETGRVEWNPFVYVIFEHAPNLNAVLELLGGAIIPTLWGGSRADILQDRLTSIQSLYEHANTEIGDWAKGMYTNLQSVIKKEREYEGRCEVDRDERFE